MAKGRFPATLSLPVPSMLLVLGLAAVMLAPAATRASLAQAPETAILVDTFEDELDDGGDDCSLREAVQAANTDGPVDGCPAGEGDDAILLPAGRYVLTLAGTDEDANATGDLDILTGTVILIGPGPERTVIDGNRLDRVLHVHDGVTMEIHGIQIAWGRTPGGDPGGERAAGGGIFNAGTLLLSYSVVVSNTTGSGDVPLVGGGPGGGIYNRGTLTLDHAWIAGNATGGGGGAFPVLGFEAGGDGGDGGGVYNRGTLALFASTIRDNRTGDGGTGGEGGNGGQGGGLYNGGTLTLMDSTVDRNQTGSGGAGALAGGTGGPGGGLYSRSAVTMSGSVIGRNTCGGGGDGTRSNGAGGPGGAGGGLYNAGLMVVTRSTVLDNTSGGGGGGGIYNGGTLTLGTSAIRDNATGDGAYGYFLGGSGGPGAGIYNGGRLELTKSTLGGNTTGSGEEDQTGQGSDGGDGGGLYNQGDLAVTDCTVSGNTTGGGNDSEQGHSGYGGGLYNAETLTLRNSTIGYNTAGRIDGDGLGGGIYAQGVLTVTNSLLAANTDGAGPRDCAQEGAALHSLGYNLVQSPGTCAFTATGDLTGIHPLLGPLGDYGGDTFTHPLLPGSPAVDRGSCPGSLTDQRGFPRPVDSAFIPNADDGCDIGAYEYGFVFRRHLPLIVRRR